MRPRNCYEIHNFPETSKYLTALAEAGTSQADHERSVFSFKGQSCETLRNDTIRLPERFELGLKQLTVHFVGAQTNGYLTLIPGEDVLKSAIEKDLRMQADIMAKPPPLYLGVQEVSKFGRVFIPQDWQEFVGFRSGEVVIAGVLSMIEIWDRAAWDAEYQKVMHLLKGKQAF